MRSTVEDGSPETWNTRRLYISQACGKRCGGSIHASIVSKKAAETVAPSCWEAEGKSKYGRAASELAKKAALGDHHVSRSRIKYGMHHRYSLRVTYTYMGPALPYGEVHQRSCEAGWRRRIMKPFYGDVQIWKEFDICTLLYSSSSSDCIGYLRKPVVEETQVATIRNVIRAIDTSLIPALYTISTFFLQIVPEERCLNSREMNVLRSSMRTHFLTTTGSLNGLQTQINRHPSSLYARSSTQIGVNDVS